MGWEENDINSFISKKQRDNSERELNNLKQLIHQFSLGFDAVCTKYPEKWLPL